MSDVIKAVVYEVTSHSKAGNFNIPREVCQLLDISDGDNVYLRITDTSSETLYFEGGKSPTSGEEISSAHGVPSKTRIRVYIEPIN